MEVSPRCDEHQAGEQKVGNDAGDESTRDVRDEVRRHREREVVSPIPAELAEVRRTTDTGELVKPAQITDPRSAEVCMRPRSGRRTDPSTRTLSAALLRTKSPGK